MVGNDISNGIDSLINTGTKSFITQNFNLFFKDLEILFEEFPEWKTKEKVQIERKMVQRIQKNLRFLQGILKKFFILFFFSSFQKLTICISFSF